MATLSQKNFSLTLRLHLGPVHTKTIVNANATKGVFFISVHTKTIIVYVDFSPVHTKTLVKA